MSDMRAMIDFPRRSPRSEGPPVGGAIVRRLALLALTLLVSVSALGQTGRTATGVPAWAASEAAALRLIEAESPDWISARAQLLRAAELGSVRAKSYLGWMSENGHGIEVDPQAAARWYAEVADAGVHEFAIKLGWMYLGVIGPDREAAERWFRHAIDAGHLPANVALASVLIADALGGLATERVFEARSLLEAALDGGERVAAFFLARLYVEGVGGHPVMADLGARYTRIAAEDGHAQMQGWLALMHLKGDGVAIDRMEAAFWAAVAAGNGDPLGRKLHEALAAELSADERKAVMNRSLLWAFDQQDRG
jgi:uncharacterized protein